MITNKSFLLDHMESLIYSLFLGFMLSSYPLQAQQEFQYDYYSFEHLRTEDHVYADNIHTVLLFKSGWELSQPLLELGRQQVLTLKFDDLKNEQDDYALKVMHCTWDWKPSDLAPSEYISGFEEIEVDQIEYSFNTTVPFVHYTVQFPNEDMQLTKSGNYLLIVYREDEPEKPVITRRFQVAEKRVRVTPVVKPSTILDQRKTHQEVDFELSQDASISNGLNQIHVVIRQNNRWDNACTNLNPSFIRPDRLIYDEETCNIFPAGNEFRQLNVKDLSFKDEHIAQITQTDTQTEVALRTAPSRGSKLHYAYKDLNGGFIVKNDLGFSPHLESDYIKLDFALKWDFPLRRENVYVFGAFSFFNFLPENQMHYNYEKKQYECSIQLKQGFYNYQFLTLGDHSNSGSSTETEGNYFETENVYAITVFLHNQNDNYDEIIGHQAFSSRNITFNE